MTAVFMAASALLTALTVLLFSSLLGAIDHLMEQAQTPDFLQMHTGEISVEELSYFAGEHEEISEWQLCRFLNLENSTISLGDASLANSTQDNGVCVQGEKFDYLLDMENQQPAVSPGEIYIPACYRSLYELHLGDPVQIGNKQFQIASFIRDSQMNSMMSSSKRFLVNASDYEALKTQGEEEYIIEFRLKDGSDTSAFAAAYAAAELPANGPAVTAALIRMMNALSDGMMILVIFLISIIVLLISLLCIHFILALNMEKEKNEAGMLKALGIGKKEIRKLYFSKYILLSVCGALAGLFAAALLKRPLMQQMQELYGVSSNNWQSGMLSVLAVLLIEAILLFSIRCSLKKVEKLSALDALFSRPKSEKRKDFGQYLFIGLVTAACTFLMLIPQNLYSTLSSPEFVTYMGIGSGEIRIDVRQTEDILQTTDQIAAKLSNDPQVAKYTVLQTRTCTSFPENQSPCSLILEFGDHTTFPVSYLEGSAPVTETELALSSLNANDLGLSVGDSLPVMIGGRKKNMTICGIYSDITNGGKTAKAAMSGDAAGLRQEDSAIMWSILYVSLNPSVSRKNWLKEFDVPGGKAVDIVDYVAETYGQTLQQIRLASFVSTGTAILIIFIVLLLFLRLIVEKNRYPISLQKALGFSDKNIRNSYMKKGMLPAAAGVISGLFLGSVLGEGLCGILLNSLGADGFRFVTDWTKILILIPVISLFTAGAAVRTGILEINNIKAYECCMRKE